MEQLVQCTSLRISLAPTEAPGVATCAQCLNTREAETGGSLEFSGQQSWSLVSSMFRRHPLKQTNKKQVESD